MPKQELRTRLTEESKEFIREAGIVALMGALSSLAVWLTQECLERKEKVSEDPEDLKGMSENTE